MIAVFHACAEPRPALSRPAPEPVVDPTTPVAGATWHGRVRAIVERRCAGCHTEGGGAPFPIGTADEAADAVWAALEGLMPPARFDPACRTTVDQRWLEEDELAAIAEWVDAGFPEGDPWEHVPGEPLPSAPEPVGDPAIVVDIGVDHVAPAGFDDAVAFTPSFGFAETTFVTASRLVVGATGIVHHATAFVVDEAGQPLMGDVYAESPSNALAAWAPGQPPWVLPDGAAFVVPAGGRLRIEVHYSTVDLAPGDPVPPDRTRVELWTRPDPPDDYAFLLPFVLTGFTIPADDPAYTLTEEGGYGGPDGTIVAVAPHMHLRGRAARMTRIRADGTEDCLADTPNFAFEQQALHWYTPEDRVVIEPSDTLRISCTWDNTGGDEVHEGPGTHDEMCQVGWLFVRPYGP